MTKRCVAVAFSAIELEEGGEVYPMGGGMFVALQRDPTAERRAMQNVVLSTTDLQALKAATGALTIQLEDGQAYDMGCGLWLVMQNDEATPGHPMQRVLVTANDADRLLAA